MLGDFLQLLDNQYYVKSKQMCLFLVIVIDMNYDKN